MKNILDILVEAILCSDLYSNKLSIKHDAESAKAQRELDAWVNSQFPVLTENDSVYGRIDAVLCSRERWMLKNGIIIGMQLAKEGLI